MSGEDVAAKLSDEAIIVAFGWFSFGAKASVTSNPPHANMKSRQSALDELVAAELITHEHETHKRYKIDRDHFRGTWAVMDMLGSERATSLLRALVTPQGMEAQRAETGTGSVHDSPVACDAALSVCNLNHNGGD